MSDKIDNHEGENEKLLGLQGFLDEVARCQELMAKYKETVQQKSDKYNQIHSGLKWNQKGRKDLDADIQALSEQNSAIQKELKEILRGGSLIEFKGKDENEDQISKEKIKILNEKLQDLKNESYEVENKYREKCKKKMIASIQIAGVKNFSMEQIEQKIDNNDWDTLFSRGVAFEEAQLQEIKERDESLQLCEKDIKELLELFQEVQDLIKGQGKTINKIEKNINNAEQSVHHGVASLKSAAREYLERNKKLMMMIAAAVVVVLLIIVISSTHSSGPEVVVEVIEIPVTTVKPGCDPDMNPRCIG